MKPAITVIGIQGMMGAGKSTIRDVLVKEFGAHWVPMSGPMKWMMKALGLSDEQLYGRLKMSPSALLCGKTVRHGLQTLGTEWGRDIIGADIWVNAVRAKIKELHATTGATRFVIDDVRFPNEAAMVRTFNEGQLWTVRRPEVEYAEDIHVELRRDFAKGRDIFADPDAYSGVHSSERWWPVAPADVVVHNTGTTEELCATVIDGACSLVGKRITFND